MKNLFSIAALTGAILLLPMAGHATVYNGNGQSGFGGELGLGTLTVSETSAGAITFQLALGNGKTSQDGNVSVYYIDSVAGGLTNTTSLTNPGTNADGQAISGNNGTVPVTFASGFGADYAVAFQDGYLDLFQLSGPSAGSITYLSGNSNPAAPNAYQFTFNASDIGLTPTSSFKFVGDLVNSNGNYFSNEAIGTLAGNPPPNPGGSGITFSGFQTFTPTPTPEPGSLVPMLMGMAALGGLIAARRRATA